MSGLRERLLRHKKPSLQHVEPDLQTSSTASTGHSEVSVLDMPSGAGSGSQSQADAVDNEWGPLGASMAANEWGEFVMKRRVYETSFRHGRYALDEIEGQSHTLMSILLPGDLEAQAGGLPYSELLFLDTETTGLGIGAGNVPFMIGIGFYEREQFVVEQMLIRHPGEELAMLYHLQQRLAQHPYLVSYNGKTFDWPIIKNRYVLNRMPSEPLISGHLDFLYPSRSLWRHTLPSCRLGKVEEERLSVHRKDDVPGSMAPALYFQYLAERDANVLRGVFEHNELDILSLAGLAIHFSHVLSGRFELAAMQLEEQYRLGLWLGKVGSMSYANQVLDQLTSQLFTKHAEEEPVLEYILPAAQLYKQQHRYEESCKLWQLYLECKGDRRTASLEPYLELAMHYEHREKRLDLALYYADQALSKVWQHQALLRSDRGGARAARGRKGMSEEERKHNAVAEAIQKRVERLRSKLERRQRGQQSGSSSAAFRSSPKKLRESSGLSMDSLF